MDDRPQQLQTIGILQLVSGIVNLTFGWVMAALIWYFLGFVISCTVGGILGMIGSLVGCPAGFMLMYCGACCGALGLILVPVGIAEIIAGAMSLSGNPAGASMGRLLSWVEISSLLAGGLVSAIIGVVVMSMYRDPDVLDYLEAQAIPESP